MLQRSAGAQGRRHADRILWRRLLAATTLATLAPIAPAQDHFATLAAPFLAAHCGRCHGPVDPQGGLDLARARSRDDVLADAEAWDWLRERVASREMPPRGEPQPTEAERAAFLAWLDGALREAADPAETAPPRPVLRRLTRRAYTNAVRDLFGVGFDARAHFPGDAVGHGFEGVGEAQTLSDAELELYVTAAEEVAAAAIFVDSPGGPRVVRVTPGRMDGAGAGNGDFWNLFVGGEAGATVELPRPGRYRVRARVHGDQAGAEPARATLVLGAEESPVFDVPETGEAPRLVEAELVADVRRPRVGARFVNDFWDPNEPDERRRDRNLGVHWLEVVGPLDPTPQTPFLAELEAAAAHERGRGRVRAALAHLVRRVWRRPATDEELTRLAALTPADAPFAARMQVALVAALASPHFLFLVEGLESADTATPEAERPLSPHELAARLAFTLWVGVPDTELDILADQGTLVEPEVLLAQVDRMLADPRAEAFVDAFVWPWLHLGPLAGRTVDEALFPEFDAALVRSMLGETRAVVARHLRQERPLRELLLGTETFVDARLAAHYGVPFDAAGEPWQLVDVGGAGRYGLLGHASVLTVTSEPTRTSAVKRGKWVLEVLLGSPPPPPPPGVDSLEGGRGADPSLPLRERLALHRADPNCAACHTRMDPLGFGLEAFDPIGRAREVAAEDRTGELPDGRRFVGAGELVQLLDGEGRFAQEVTERLFVYALGRGPARADRPRVVEVLGAAGPEPTLRGLLRALLVSPSFTRVAGP